MKINKYIKPVALGLLLFTSCNDDILEKTNPNELPAEGFLENEIQLQAAVNATYAALQTRQLYGREYFFLHDMLADENTGTSGLEAPRGALLNYNIDAGNFIIVETWQGFYRLIHRANLVIANIENIPEIALNVEARNRYEAEARFLRAWAYFELVSLWGDVPLITEPADTETTKTGIPRASVETIYSEVIFPDLNFAEKHLLTRGEYEESDLGRVTKGAAQALKGKIHLFRGNYSEAVTELQKVVNSGNYSLTKKYQDNFIEETENNVESVFEVQFSTAHGYGNPWSANGTGIDEVTFRGQEYTPQTGWRNVNPTADLKATFEEGDPRYDFNFYLDEEKYNNGENVMDLTEPGWQKYSNAYKQADEKQISGINFRVIRYADVLLMLAEALVEAQGAAAIPQALEYINMVRGRVGLADIKASDVPNPDELFDIIVRERRVEFPAEQIRNRDIRRWRREGKLDSEPIANFKPHHVLLPLPTPEINNNAALTEADQNPGY